MPVGPTVEIDPCPLYDLVASLFVLANYGEYDFAREDWTAEMSFLGRAADDVREAIDLCFKADLPVGLALIPVIAAMDEPRDFASLLAELRALPGERLVELGLFPSLADLELDPALRKRVMARPHELWQVLERAGLEDAAKRKAFNLLVAPDRFKKTLLDLLEAYWRDFFEGALSRTARALESLAAAVGARMREMTPAELLQAVVTLEGTRPVVLAPSHYISPYSIVYDDDDRGVLIVLYGREVVPPVEDTVDLAEVTEFLKVMADETRLRIARLLAEREMYGGELAAILGLTPPTISHHLTKLRASGLIESARRGGYVYYSLRSEALKRLLDDTGRYILPELQRGTY